MVEENKEKKSRPSGKECRHPNGENSYGGLRLIDEGDLLPKAVSAIFVKMKNKILAGELTDLF